MLTFFFLDDLHNVLGCFRSKSWFLHLEPLWHLLVQGTPRFLQLQEAVEHIVLHWHLEAEKSFFGLFFKAAWRRDIFGKISQSSTVKLRFPS